MRGDIPDAAEAARDYENALRRGFAAAGRDDCTFDVMLLGLGEDAHIASVFPGSPLLETIGSGSKAPSKAQTMSHGATDVASAPSRGGERVAAVWATHLHAWRITLTPAAILDSRDS